MTVGKLREILGHYPNDTPVATELRCDEGDAEACGNCGQELSFIEGITGQVVIISVVR